jgi:hypothetical protein
LQEILQNYLGDGVDSETNLVQWMRLYSRLQGVVLFRAYSNQCEMSTNERKERFQVLLAFARMCNPTPTEQGLEWPLFMAMMATQGIEGIYSQALLVVEECLVREIVMKLTGDKREDFAHLVLIALKTLCMESLIAYKMKAKVELNRAELYGSHSGKSEDLYKQYESERENFVTSFYPHLREIYPDGPVEGAEIVNPPSMILVLGR